MKHVNIFVRAIAVAGITDFLYHNNISVIFLQESNKSARPQPVTMSKIREPSIFLRESNETYIYWFKLLQQFNSVNRNPWKHLHAWAHRSCRLWRYWSLAFLACTTTVPGSIKSMGSQKLNRIASWHRKAKELEEFESTIEIFSRFEPFIS